MEARVPKTFRKERASARLLEAAARFRKLPRVSKLRIPGVSAVLEPSTARTAATAFAGFLEGGAHGTSVAADSGSARHRSSRRGRFCGQKRIE